ncbi:hypothetical protein Rsub_05176 [Raphidocelis subcapitata]|uniref:Chitin-binding type-4 domain-containing protein n=1 Tax=Raphidocelis subcapitata TaxID=307507 RepID=A0A2V0P0W6_9CHLO|nr:hypothetical protein Rsub_05176 [Raphidocelis subcapitata]|eukprot:GBF92562.1 hypothetical protein Rsub_05176 [Raphidocelis subcapitata]
MAPAARAALAAAAALALLLLATPAHGHGILVHPPSRNWMMYLQKNLPRPHELNMGGPWVVSDGGKHRYPDSGRRGTCGDAWNETRWAAPAPVRAAYSAGQTLTADVLVVSNHMGRFKMQVCDVGDKQGKGGRCRDLTLKSPGDASTGGNATRHWWMPALTQQWEGGNWGGEGPSYGDGTFSAYQLPSISEFAGWGCTGRRLCDQFRGMWVYRTQWQLPGNFTCEHCKLQWSWMTAHVCWPTCAPGETNIQCANRQPYGICGQPGTAYPEEFVNCADIKISDAAKTPATANLPPWNDLAKASLKSGAWGAVRPPVLHGRV